MSTDDITVMLTRKLSQMRQQAEWGKQAQAHAVISMAFTVEALVPVAEAAIEEHSSHFEQYRDDEDGCPVCFYLGGLIR